MEVGPKFCVLKPHRCGAWENGRHWVERGIESEEDAAVGRVRQPMLPVDRRRESAMASWDSGWAWMLRKTENENKTSGSRAALSAIANYGKHPQVLTYHSTPLFVFPAVGLG